MGFLGLVITGRNAPPVLELVEEALDLITPFVFGIVVRDWLASVAFCRNDGLVDLLRKSGEAFMS